MSRESGRALSPQEKGKDRKSKTVKGYSSADDQADAEASIVANFSLCNIRGQKEKTNPDNIDLEEVKRELHDNYFNAGLLNAVSCMFDFAIHTAIVPSANENGLPSITDAIKDYIANLHRIGAESVEGVALMGGVEDVKDLIIIKAPKDPKYDGLLHEYFVGVVALNQLRADIPNFMYTLAGFKCGAPRLRGKEVVEWCSTKSKAVNFVVYEKISGMALNDAMKEITLRDFLSYYIQILLSTLMAAERYSYTHYDLHDGNVLLREVDIESEFWIPYHFAGGETYYVFTNKVATIIDYGRVHIKYKGHHYGYWGMEQDGLFHDKARPLHDLYKVLGFACYSALEAKRTDLLRELAPLFKFFKNRTSITNFTTMLKVERENYFELSPTITKKEQETSLRDLLAYIKENYDTIFNEIVAPSIAKNAPMLTCSGVKSENESGQCGTLTELLTKLSPKIEANPRSKSRSRSRSLPAIVSDMRNVTARYGDLKLCKDEVDCDIEARALTDKLERLNMEFNNDFDRAHKEMKRRLTKMRKELSQQIMETDLDISVETGESPEENEEILMEFTSEIGPFLELIDSIRAYAQELALLNRAEEQAGVEKTPISKYRMPLESANAAAVVISSLREYLETFTDDMLTDNGRDMVNTLLSKLW